MDPVVPTTEIQSAETGPKVLAAQCMASVATVVRTAEAVAKADLVSMELLLRHQDPVQPRRALFRALSILLAGLESPPCMLV